MAITATLQLIGRRGDRSRAARAHGISRAITGAPQAHRLPVQYKPYAGRGSRLELLVGIDRSAMTCATGVEPELTVVLSVGQ